MTEANQTPREESPSHDLNAQDPAAQLKAMMEGGGDDIPQHIALEHIKQLYEAQQAAQASANGGAPSGGAPRGGSPGAGAGGTPGGAGAAGGPGPQGAPRAAQPPLPIDWSTEGVPAATNGVQVLHRPTEFAVLFTDYSPFPGRRSPDGQSGNERAVVVSSLRMSPDAMFQAICALANSWNRFATTVIDPRMRQPRFKLVDAGELQLEGFKDA